MNNDEIRSQLLAQKAELATRVDRIHQHARDPLEADSSEQAAQLGNVEVVSALETEAVAQLAEIEAALQRLELGQYGQCANCGAAISPQRLQAMPASTECLECADVQDAGRA